MSLAYKLTQEGDDQVLYLEGEINEKADFSPAPLHFTGRLIVDMRHVKVINSIGCRNWILWTKALQAPGGLYLRACPSFIVHQFSILHGFLPEGALVQSFSVPYYCDSCGEAEEHTAENGRDYVMTATEKSPPTTFPESKRCPVCGETMSLDVIPERYFRFLKSLS